MFQSIIISLSMTDLLTDIPKDCDSKDVWFKCPIKLKEF